MNLSLILLSTGLTLISQIEELEYEPKVHLIEPYVVGGKTKVTLTKWPDYTDDVHILLKSESLLTVCEPTEEIVKMYLKKVGKTEKDLTTPSQPVILTEDENLLDSDDDYEPRYQEV